MRIENRQGTLRLPFTKAVDKYNIFIKAAAEFGGEILQYLRRLLRL